MTSPPPKTPVSPPAQDGHRPKPKKGRGTPTIEDLRRMAAKRKGKCLANEYTDSKTKVPWRCAKGHEWMAQWNSVQYHWCPKCARIQKLELKEFVRIARERGGKLLSTEYVNGNTPMLWRCGQGHTWWAKPAQVKGNAKYHLGNWCRLCAHQAQRGKRHQAVTLEDMKEIARERGGDCISDFYVNAYTKMKWRCARGHEWMANRTTIKRSWCPECAKKLEFEQVVATATEHGGKLLSPRSKFVNGASVVRWQCAMGHRWTQTVLHVRQGSWCPRCKADSYWNIQDMREIARERGGVCLSKTYRHFEKPLRWRCAEGHVFKATPRDAAVRRIDREQWCPVCARRPKHSLEDLQRIARERGGECLSGKAGTTKTHLRWRCARGHVWPATPAQIIGRGTWCKECSRDRSRLGLDSMRELARAHDGVCISKKYVNSQTALRWRCRRQHVFLRTPKLVKERGVQSPEEWCPVCRSEARRNAG